MRQRPSGLLVGMTVVGVILIITIVFAVAQMTAP